MFSDCKFGSVTYRGREYRSDIVVHVDGSVTPRRKEISRRKYGTSHVMAEEELEELLEEKPESIIIGSGVHGALETGFRSDATVLPTCEAIKRYNEERSAGRRVAAIIHVTC
ncbi:Mth938-like domain-containing protein [Methanothermobacter sp. EMTCatA1]|jgi:hypothetical protein|uniref:Mth938-like domain-containing protein n=1 Tax=Methanothermobacter sp. EMTCatA1 TaxID=2017966 RepID=UPI000B5E9E74|nr:MTH938/NDUFAF3 family protein [Methanothermobacter sp. EMTCatA1]BAZ98969.1 hypothetical protein tca_00901 [Methanothermobacter sp. EMTCatA1]